MFQTILITGSTDGIGKLAAINLAKDGHEVYLHGRDTQKLASVINEVKKQSGSEKVDGFMVDFSDLKKVRQSCIEITKKLSKLDVIINNAGVLKSSNNETPSGIDLRLVVNYLAPFVLTEQLKPLLHAADQPRVINVSSAAQSSVSIDALKGPVQLHTQEAYAQSKLALIMWSFHLAKAEPTMSVITVNPGSLLNTKMAREAYGKFWSPAEKGGNILYDLAVSEDYTGVTGVYFDNDKGPIKGEFGPAHSDAYDRVLITSLMSATHAIVGLS